MMQQLSCLQVIGYPSSTMNLARHADNMEFELAYSNFGFLMVTGPLTQHYCSEKI